MVGYTQQWPQDWKRSVLIPIPKKGNAKECSNYRTIAGLTCVSTWEAQLNILILFWDRGRHTNRIVSEIYLCVSIHIRP